PFRHGGDHRQRLPLDDGLPARAEGPPHPGLISQRMDSQPIDYARIRSARTLFLAGAPAQATCAWLSGAPPRCPAHSAPLRRPPRLTPTPARAATCPAASRRLL